ncbi:MAG: phosphodiester glycosidase family protein [Acidobacteria bacterium]|nr:phosphodiester glycosidase family protein [Acidobacteriota bacterium]
MGKSGVPGARWIRAGAVIGLVLSALACGDAPRPAWTTLHAGLELGEFPAPEESRQGDSRIHVLRVDPRLYELRLLAASAPGNGKSMTAREWCQAHGLVAAINAGLFGEDGTTPVSLARTRAHTANGHLTRDKAVLAFDPLDPGAPPVQIIDREHQQFEELRERYGSFVQSIRMVSLGGENVWDPQPRRHSVAAIAIDRGGFVLLIHSQSPFSVHDLIDALLELPLSIRNAMYLEGGPLAQLFVRAGGSEREFVGLAEGALLQHDEVAAGPIPNVLGVARRAER